jgi:hypothetical protein
MRALGVRRIMWPARPVRAAGTSRSSRDAPTCRQVDVAHVDAQLQRRGRDERAQLPLLEALLRVEAVLLREAAVVRGDGVLAEDLGQPRGDALGHFARVHEDQGRLVTPISSAMRA